MSEGLKVFDASENPLVDPDTSMGRILGTVTSGTGGGSLSDADFAQGIPFAICANISGFLPPAAQLGPVVSFGGTTMTWTATTYSALIYYGVY